jgi:broad specificity phosphatase PhoE
MKSMKIYLIRHGETTGDIEDRYGGSYDDHLTNKGQEQLRLTANNLVGKEIEKIFSSPLIRAQESSEIISQRIGAPIEYLGGLQERHYGVLTGLTKQDAQEKYPEVVELHKDPKNTDPEGEGQEEFNKRVVEAFRLVATKEYKVVAIVSHGGPIKTIFKSLGSELLRSIGDGEIFELDIK